MAKVEETRPLVLRLKLKKMHRGEFAMPFVLAIAFLLILPGCATMTGTAGTNGAACDVWKPISWSQKDTDVTIAEVKTNNARRAGFCGDR
jgi:hypothetical protein